MKCIRFHEYGGADQLRLEEIDPPRPGPGEVLIDVTAAAVNPVDFKLRSGIVARDLPLSLPYVPGADFSGTITAVGAGVSESRIGERVIGMGSVLRGGAYAEQMTALAEEAVPLPDGLDLVKAVELPMGAMTGYDLIEAMNVRNGERVIVTGAAGSVGRAAVFAAAARGAVVIALVRAQPDVPISGALKTIVLPNDEAIADTGPYDCVADTVGGELAQSLVKHLRPHGRFRTVVGQVPTLPVGSAISVGYVIVTSGASKLLSFAKAVASGAVQLPEPQLLPLEKAAEAHRRLEAGGVGSKLILIL